MEIVIFAGIIAGSVYVTWWIISLEIKKRKLRDIYYKALEGTDKKVAIEAGRAWCIASRKYNMVTDRDEEMIAKAVSKMRTE
jgi:hypothetical protein